MNTLGRSLVGVLLSVALCLGTSLFPMGTVWMAKGEAPETLSIVATVFPAYDFAKTIAGESATVQMLLPPGGESHSYEPTPKDIIAIENADLFVMVGGESESWVVSILDALGEDAPPRLALMDCVETLEEELSLSMESDDHEDEDGSDVSELDEHVWISPKNVMEITKQLTDVLCRLNPGEVEGYQSRGEDYLSELDKLDQALSETISGGARRKIIFGDRFPFRYLAHDYGLEYDAAFPGCSEDSEPSARTIASLIKEIQRDHIPVIFYIEFSNGEIAQVLAEETGAKTLLLHSCHNVGRNELEEGVTYLSLMWENVAALGEALK